MYLSCKYKTDAFLKFNEPILFFFKRRKIVSSSGLIRIIHLQRMAFKVMYQNDLVKLALEGIVECVKVTWNDGRSLP